MTQANRRKKNMGRKLRITYNIEICDALCRNRQKIKHSTNEEKVLAYVMHAIRNTIDTSFVRGSRRATGEPLLIYWPNGI
jgi:hypothetical protein